MAEEEIAEEQQVEEEAAAEEGAEEAQEENAEDAGEEAAEEPAAEEAEEAAEEAAEEPAAEEEENDEIDEDLAQEGLEIKDHLKDAMEGNLRLKRLLSREDNNAPDPKRRKTDGSDNSGLVQAKIRQLMMKWQLVNDACIKHILEGATVEELTEMSSTNYMPDKFHGQKSPAELLARHVGDLRERKIVAGSSQDIVASFKFKWKLDIASDKKLRALTHKELRHVVTVYDGETPLDDIIEEAKGVEADEVCTVNAAPDFSGILAMGRFNRLELIDPLADCAVFGDANLTFSLKLAKHRKALGHVGRVIATTFEEVETLRERYKEIDQSIKTLEEHFAEVYHGVDCTRIAIDPRFEGMEEALGAVYYNFPHSGAIQGFFDGHPMVNWRHENLMRLFFRALRSFVKPGGVVKVSSNMGAVGVRYSYIVGSAIENEFLHIETVPFLEWHLHRYGRSYGDKRDVYKRPDATNNQSYNAQAADRDMVYCFKYEPSGTKLPPQTVRLPPTLKTLNACVEGPFRMLQDAARKNLAQQLHKRFVTEISGTHVG